MLKLVFFFFWFSILNQVLKSINDHFAWPMKSFFIYDDSVRFLNLHGKAPNDYIICIEDCTRTVADL